MSGRKFYIADWHYGHGNIIAYDNRPFKSTVAMNEALVENWNRAVTPGDMVYVLGDMFWCKSSEAVPVLEGLNGQKILVRGNHDRCNDGKFLKQFSKVTDYLEIEDEGNHVVLCHYPIPCFKNHFYGWFHLYGHVHTGFEANMMESVCTQLQDLYDRPCRMYNVGAMMPYMEYTPRTLEEITSARPEYI